MFNFSKKTASTAELEATYKEARDMWSPAFHIVNEKEEALCGKTSVMFGHRPVTPEYVIDTLDKQHNGWYWCSDCGASFTELPKETFYSKRKEAA